MALGLAERLGDFGISQAVFSIDELFALEKKLLNSEKTTTLVIDVPKKMPHTTISKYKLVETIIRMASRDNNIIMTGYPGESIYDTLVETATKFIASRDINIIGIELHSYNDPGYLSVMNITPSKDILKKYDARFKEAIKS